MAIFDDLDPATQTVRLIQDTLSGSLNQMRAAFDNGQMLVWANPYGLTPQQVLDALGTDAAVVFAASMAAEACINRPEVPEAKWVHGLMPAEVAPTINQDGTVTLVYS